VFHSLNAHSGKEEIMNNISLVGRIGQDPETRTTAGGSMIAKFSLAVERGRKDQDGNKSKDWFTVKAFGKTAEVVAEYVRKGTQLAVAGNMVNEKWEAKDGAKRDGWQVLADRVTLLGGRESESTALGDAGEIPF
jgi:single-strand DNA-binding protein